MSNGCPCLVTDPCDSQCSCANGFLSAGCRRCARYGSLEQRKRAALYLVEQERKAVALDWLETHKDIGVKVEQDGRRSLVMRLTPPSPMFEDNTVILGTGDNLLKLIGDFIKMVNGKEAAQWESHGGGVKDTIKKESTPRNGPSGGLNSRKVRMPGPCAEEVPVENRESGPPKKKVPHD